MALVGLLIFSNRISLAEVCLHAGPLVDADALTKIGLVSLLGLFGIVTGAVVGIIGFMKRDTTDNRATAAGCCPTCGSPAAVGARFCVACGTAAKPGPEPKQ